MGSVPSLIPRIYGEFNQSHSPRLLVATKNTSAYLLFLFSLSVRRTHVYIHNANMNKLLFFSYPVSGQSNLPGPTLEDRRCVEENFSFPTMPRFVVMYK